MKITIPYGRGCQEAEATACDILRAAEPSDFLEQEEKRDEKGIVEQALAHPFGGVSLCGIAAGASRVLLIASDHTRPVPSRIIVPLMLEQIRRGNPGAEIRILIAGGLHRKSTDRELTEKFGEDIVKNETILQHDSTDASQMTERGTLPSGGKLRLNSLIEWADLIVSEGFIEPHFFAGFSGGRKSILPGIADARTVCGNHCAEFIAHPCTRTGILDSNPIHEDMVFSARAAGLRFIVNTVQDADKRIIAAFAGDPFLAHEAGCGWVQRHLSVPRPEQEADIVVTSNGGYPLDQNLYQCVKGMTAAESCVRQDGVIILCAECIDGAGGDAFVRYFAGRRDPNRVWGDIMSVPQEDTRPDQWQAQILARVMMRAQVLLVTREENRETVESMGMRFMPSLSCALEHAYTLVKSRRLLVIPDGVGIIISRAVSRQ